MKKNFSYIKSTSNGFILELPLIKRTFESLYINYKSISSSLGMGFENIFVDNYIFGMTQLTGGILFYSLDLNNFEEEELLIDSFDIKTINIAGINYSLIIIYYKGEYKVISSIPEVEYKLDCNDDGITIRNTVLDSIIFSKTFVNKKYCIDSFSKQSLIDSEEQEMRNATDYSLVDMYSFNNFFITSKSTINFGLLDYTYYSFNENLSQEFHPRNILSLYKGLTVREQKVLYGRSLFHRFFGTIIPINYTTLADFKKYLFFKNNHDFILDFRSTNLTFKKFFEKFYNISTLEKDTFIKKKINLSFSDIEHIPKDLEIYNRQILLFQMNVYKLDKNSDKISKIKNSLDNPKVKEQKLRLGITEKNLNKIKGEYIDLLKKYLSNI